MRLRFLTILCCILPLGAIHAADLHRHEKLDSVIAVIDAMPNDSTRLRQSYISIQENLDQYWTLDLIEYAQKLAQKCEHLKWEMAFRGCKIRWTHRFHDWERMDRFLNEQREVAIRQSEYGNYLSQIGQSAIVMAQVGRFEQSWRYIQQMEKDVVAAGEKKFKIYNYLVEAEYYKYSGQEEKRLQLLLDALDDDINTSTIQRSSLHIELIGVFGQMKQYDKALAHADSVLYIYDSFSEARKALPQSRGNISEANLKKVEMYHAQGNLPMMRSCLEIAQEYVNTKDPKNVGDLYFWWAKYCLGIGDHAMSMEYIDKAVEVYHKYKTEDTAILAEMGKVDVLRAMGRDAEALDVYKTKLFALDSVRNEMICAQEAYLGELGEMISQRARRERMRTMSSNLTALLACLMALIVISILAYIIHVNRKLRRNYRVIEEKMMEASRADKEKERFLRNITQLINDPLQSVVDGARRLSDNASMTPEEQAVLVQNNNEHVRRLLGLINNVLDLSRLEAGMMKYSLYDTDVVRLVHDYVADYNLNNIATPIRISSSVESFTMKIDEDRLCKIVDMLFSIPFNCSTGVPSYRAIRMEKAGADSLRLILTGSLFADESTLDETELMTNRIVKYMLDDFRSGYETNQDFDIIITLHRM